MSSLSGGITSAGQAAGEKVWNIMGQTYHLKSECDDCCVFESHLPPGTGVPPHIHRTQDEYFYILEGVLQVEVGGQQSRAGPGDLVRLPRAVPHAFKVPEGAAARMIAWVTPAGKLRALFEKLDNLTDIEEAIRLAAQHDVDFVGPPP